MGITKTVYNPDARKPAQRTSEESLKKKQVRAGGDDGKVGVVGFSCKKSSGSRASHFLYLFTQEALKLQQDVRKKKQEILEKHIETQKVE